MKNVLWVAVLLFSASAWAQAPVAVPDVYSVQRNTATAIPVLENDTSIASDAVSIDRLPPNGSAWVDVETRSVIYSPTPGYVGPDNLAYKITNAEGSAIGVVTIEVQPPATAQPFLSCEVSQDCPARNCTWNLGLISCPAYACDITIVCL